MLFLSSLNEWWRKWWRSKKKKGKERRKEAEKRNPLSAIAYYLVVLIGYLLALDFFSDLLGDDIIKNNNNININNNNQKKKKEFVKLFWFTLHAMFGILSHLLVLKSDPGIVTEKNHKVCYKMFPFDDLLYEEGKSCRTLNIDIPARSKWDAVTNRRVCKFDHYCAVVNQSIGLRNLRWFLLFLIVNGRVVAARRSRLLEQGDDADTLKHWHSVKEKDFFGLFLPALMYHHTRSMFSMFVLFSVGFGVLGFALYHIYLVSMSVTTNETYKYARHATSE